MTRSAADAYTVLRPLARSDLSEVFLARSEGMAGIERVAVVKTIHARFTDDEDTARAFDGELGIAQTLQHPNIVQVYDVGSVGRRRFVATEHVHGRDLAAILERCRERGLGHVPFDIALIIGSNVCAALHYAHQARDLSGLARGVVHCDPSPPNLLASFEGHVKVVDFGVARAAARVSAARPGLVPPKVAYLAPEEIAGRRPDSRTDVFHLAVALWEATTGTRLFDKGDAQRTLWAIANGKIRRPSAVVPDYPIRLEQVLLRALASDPSYRYPTAQDMQLDLAAAAQDIGSSLGPLTLARFLEDLFAPELDTWHEIDDRGGSFLDYLLTMTPDRGAPPTRLTELLGRPPSEIDTAEEPVLEAAEAAKLRDAARGTMRGEAPSPRAGLFDAPTAPDEEVSAVADTAPAAGMRKVPTSPGFGAGRDDETLIEAVPILRQPSRAGGPRTAEPSDPDAATRPTATEHPALPDDVELSSWRPPDPTRR